MIFRNRGPLALLAAEVVSRVGSQMTFLAVPCFVLVTTLGPLRRRELRATAAAAASS